MERNGREWNGTEQAGMEQKWNGRELKQTKWNGIQYNRKEWSFD